MWLFLFSLLISSVIAQTGAVKESLNKLDSIIKTREESNCLDASCRDEDKLGCAQQFDGFCNQLYSSENKGNMDVVLSSGEKIKVRYAKNEKNEDPNFAAWNQAVLKYKNNLPADLKAHLANTSYFKQLEEYSTAVKTESVNGAVENSEKWQEVSSIWSKALFKVGIARVEKEIPGYGDKKKRTFAEEKRAAEIFNKLRAEINASIWSTSPEWKKVQTDYNLLKIEFVRHIQSNKSLSDKTKKSMIARIQTMKLALPGSDEENVDDSCAQTDVNANYMFHLNRVTVCAGLFSIPSITIMAHEIAHAIDPHRMMDNDHENSSLAQNFGEHLLKSCEETKPSCDEWEKLKKQLMSPDLKRNEYYSETYLQCLRDKQLNPWPEDSVIKEIVTTDVNSFVDLLAKSNWMLKLTTPERRNDMGEKEKNEFYMNACKMFDIKYDKFNLTSNVVTTLTLINEFRCSKEEKIGDRLIHAGEQAKAVGFAYRSKLFQVENNLNDSDQLINRGYASPLGEKVADNIGLSVAAKVIADRATSVEDRRKITFSSLSLFCDGFSLAADNPELAKAQKHFSTAVHSQNYSRRRELMTRDIRTVLGCEKDLESKDCEL